MSFINANIPPIEAFVRTNFLQNRPHKFAQNDDYLPCLIIGVASIPGMAPLFHFVMEDGGLWWRMPIHAFCSKKDTPQEELHQLVLWDSFSYHVGVTTFSFLHNKKMVYYNRNKEEKSGRYLFTLDWAGGDSNVLDAGFSEIPGQHKCGHVIELEDGNYAIQPNNRVKLFEPSYITKWGQTIIDRRLGTELWTVENKSRWILSDDDRYEYDMKEVK
jgi:hypothetical protein